MSSTRARAPGARIKSPTASRTTTPHEIDCGCSCPPTCEYCGAELADDDPGYCCREAEYDNAEDQAEYQRTAEIERSLWRYEP